MNAISGHVVWSTLAYVSIQRPFQTPIFEFQSIMTGFNPWCVYSWQDLQMKRGENVIELSIMCQMNDSKDVLRVTLKELCKLACRSVCTHIKNRKMQNACVPFPKIT